jgi:dTDP-4-amino-4,6-dideoxygalactose transaminase
MTVHSTLVPLTGESAPQLDILPEKKAPKAKRAAEAIPILRPQLPSTSDILPYLQAIDSRRWYSNYGPLVQQLEQELSKRLGARDHTLVTVSNATAGITAALLALGLKQGALCLMPSWTFAATPHAAKAAGLTPMFHDVERGTWALNPEQVRETLRKGYAVEAVVVVSPFGAPLRLKAWQQFQDETGVRVVIDAAAGFDTVTASVLPSVVSLHATKVFAAGEGGFVLSTDAELGHRVRSCCNFGFQNSRVALCSGFNAKMSEYHAAVALASLARWPFFRLKHLKIMEWYTQALARIPGVALHPGYGEGWATGTTSVILPSASAPQVAALLLRSGVETRSWWGQGCHVQPAFAGCPRGELPVTEDLGGRVLGLPHYPDLEEEDVWHIATVLAHALRSLGGRRQAS